MKKVTPLITCLLAISLSLLGCSNKQNNKSGSKGNNPSHIVSLDIVAFNDLHGNTLDSDSGLGLAKTTTLVNELTKHSNNRLLISQGDMWQGSAESNLTHGNLVTEWMNEQGFVSMTLGNHEFDWGQDDIASNKELANFPFLAINIYSTETNSLASYCQPSTIATIGSAKIGIIGAIGDCYSSISSSQVKDIYFKVGDELTSLVKAEAKSLKEQGCDFIIYSIHDDDSAYNLDLSDGYVDLVLEGHTHKNYVRKDAKGVYHVQGGGYNKSLPYIRLDIDTANDTYDIKKIQSIYTNDYWKLPDNENAQKIFDKYQSVIGTARMPIGVNSSRRDSTYLRNLVSELYLEAGLEKWGEQYNIFLGGGYISCRSPYYLSSGDVSYADLYNLFPFDNDIQLCSVSGASLLKQFINTDNENYFIDYSLYGEGLVNNIDNNETYYIVTDSYSSDYGPNNLTVIESYNEDGYYARDLLKDYIVEGGLENKITA